MGERPAELCFICGLETGHAGAGDGSIYWADSGPWCDDCSQTLREEVQDDCIPEIRRLRAENERLIVERTTAWDVFEPCVYLYHLPGAPVVPTFAQMLQAAVNDLLRTKKGTRSPEELFIEHAHDGAEQGGGEGGEDE